MKKNITKDRGFTLIELLVVIAIIGLLSAIILASLSVARNKGNDGKVEAELTSIRTAAEIYNNLNGTTYTGMCSVTSSDTSGLYPLLQTPSYPKGTTITCNSTATAYAVQATLSTAGNYWCVDSTGKPKADSSALGGGTVCP